MCNRLTKLSVTMWYAFFRYIRWYVTMDSTQNAWSVTMWYTRRIVIWLMVYKKKSINDCGNMLLLYLYINIPVSFLYIKNIQCIKPFE